MFDPPKWAAPFLAAIFNGEGFKSRAGRLDSCRLGRGNWSLGDEWIRYSVTNWRVWSEKSTMTITERLDPALDTRDAYLVSSIDPSDFTGKLPRWAWDWIRARVPDIVLGSEHPELFPALPSPRRF